MTDHSERMVFPLWRSLSSLNLMLPKEDRKAMLLRLYNEDIPLMDHSKDRHKVHDSSPVKEEDSLTIGDDEVSADGGADSKVNGEGIEAEENEMDVEAQAAEELDVVLGVKDEEDVDIETGSDVVKGPADV